MTMPDGVYLARFTGPSEADSGQLVTAVVLWSDGGYCTECGRNLPPQQFSLQTDTGTPQAWARKCPECNTSQIAPWVSVPDDPERIQAAAETLAARAEDAAADLVDQTNRRVQAALDDALARIQAGEDVEDVADGDDLTPGVMVDAGQLVSWAHHPIDEGEIIQASAPL
ncbi:hypothetical protein KIH74_22765 [Kineosporia sp. J2-2]|uniref:Uncharacterized protein n=1 Tax=Kineosporia corallincola TaxID=2835133 RepID=A0ABS5TL04_9ACTN|nr:hypothetical protein [Kineosporia corallincola]MBT0771781.1 hypothetical protein [Kineosporia corallincola]